MKKRDLRIARYLRYTALIILLVISLFWFVFALLSGSEEYGGGIKGILMNSPNALPWLLLLIFVFISWKWEVVGGTIILIMGIFTIYFFNVFKHLFSFFVFSLPLMILGLFLILSWWLKRKN